MTQMPGLNHSPVGNFAVTGAKLSTWVEMSHMGRPGRPEMMASIV